LHCAYDLCGLVAEAYVEVHRGGRIAIRRMVRCPECGFLQRYFASAPGGRLEPHPAAPPRQETARGVALIVVVSVVFMLLIGLLVMLVSLQ
jgi:hypothetical protein